MRRFNLLSFCIIGLLLINIGCDKDTPLVTPDDSNEQLESRQIERLTNRLIFPCEAFDFTVTIPECLDQEWVTAIHQAMDEFNNLDNVAINMRVLTSQEIADGVVPDVPFVCSERTCFEVADIFFPVITIGFATFEPVTIELTAIDEVVDCCDNFVKILDTDCLFKGVIMHELMHTLGFSHDGDLGLNEQVVQGTPLTDENSIMIGNDGCVPRCVFSEFDIVALEALYPWAEISGPQALCPGASATFCVTGSEAVESVDWVVPSNMSIVSQSGLCITVELEHGNTVSSSISATVSLGDDCDYTLYNSVATGLPNFSFNFNGPVCLGDVVTFTLNQHPNGQSLNNVTWSVTSGGFNIMSQNGSHAVMEALSAGPSQVCATATNSCGFQKQSCQTINIDSDSNCNGDGGPGNPK